MGTLVGVSTVMRATFALLLRAARSDVTVLLEGETGTGKEGAAEAIHQTSRRRDKPFVIVDCGAIPANLLESELFGHERGSFTGATGRRIGAFEEASGGTLFLDEIGELPTELQPKLLRALERKQFRRVGANLLQSADVRIVAATNRDLRSEATAGSFRPDLYFRLAVLRIVMPPLDQRREDIPVLVPRLLATLGAAPEEAARLCAPDFIARLQATRWTGNVRELRNHLETCLALGQEAPVSGADARPAAGTETYAEARKRALDAFERSYLASLLARHGGKVAQAAEEAGVDRVHLYRLMRRHGVRNT